jgi:hypothetical protein
MARHPDWFDRLESIHSLLQSATHVQWLGRTEIKAIFQCSDRDSIRLLHKFGAEIRENCLSVERLSVLGQLEAIRSDSTYAAFLQKRNHIARSLTTAQAESHARQFRVAVSPSDEGALSEFHHLPETIVWRRTIPSGLGLFQIAYRDGADLMSQIAQFLTVAGSNRHEFLNATEPDDGPGH